MDETRDSFYTSPAWRTLRERVLARDNGRCVVGYLLGGACSELLHVHHVEARADRPDLALDPDNLVVVCATHHPSWEALARLLRVLSGETELPPCGHVHRYRAGREACERRRREQLALRRASRLAA